MLGRVRRAVSRLCRPAWLAVSADRARVAVAGLLLVCAGNVYVLRDVVRLWQPPHEHQWDPQTYAQRLAGVRQDLPGGAHIGYVNPRFGNDPIAQRQDLFATRYALSPICIVPGDDPSVVLESDAAVPVGGDRTILREDAQHGWRLTKRTPR